MRQKRFLVSIILVSLLIIFIHSEMDVPCECHQHHDIHNFKNLISNSLINKPNNYIEQGLKYFVVTFK